LYVQLAQYLLGLKLILEKKFHENHKLENSKIENQNEKEALACVMDETEDV